MSGEQTAATHEWSRDGERCIKCGAKDWMDAPCVPVGRQEMPIKYLEIMGHQDMQIEALEAENLSLREQMRMAREILSGHVSRQEINEAISLLEPK